LTDQRRSPAFPANIASQPLNRRWTFLIVGMSLFFPSKEAGEQRMFASRALFKKNVTEGWGNGV
jgi:hypothetical protein